MATEYTERLPSASEGYASQAWGGDFSRVQGNATEAALQFLRDYSRERPETVAMWAFGIGFILGWKLKPW